MNWDYIAGFFDGEGSAGVYKKRTGTQRFINFSNTDVATLEAIRDFMDCGRIALQKTSTPTRRPCYVLYVRKIEDLNRVAPELVTRCRIKTGRLAEVIADLDGRTPAKNVGRMAAFGRDEIARLYASGLSISAVARKVGVTSSSMGDFLVRNGISKRTRDESYLLSGRGRLPAFGSSHISELYANGATVTEIGQMVGVSGGAVWSYMKRQGIPLRTRHESRKLRRSLAKHPTPACDRESEPARDAPGHADSHRQASCCAEAC